MRIFLNTAMFKTSVRSRKNWPLAEHFLLHGRKLEFQLCNKSMFTAHSLLCGKKQKTETLTDLPESCREKKKHILSNVSCPPFPVFDQVLNHTKQNLKVSKGEVQGHIHLSCPSQCDVGKDSFHSSPRSPPEIGLLSCDKVFGCFLCVCVFFFVRAYRIMWHYVAL